MENDAASLFLGQALQVMRAGGFMVGKSSSSAEVAGSPEGDPQLPAAGQHMGYVTVTESLPVSGLYAVHVDAFDGL